MSGIPGKTSLGVAGLYLVASAAVAQAPVMPPPIPATARLEASNRLTLGNGVLSAVVYPPGENAFYRGTRFDRSGVIGSLRYGTQEYYGPWFSGHRTGDAQRQLRTGRRAGQHHQRHHGSG
jgi:hypothetical protein